MMKRWLFLLLTIIAIHGFTQTESQFLVKFKHKESLSDLASPETFLSLKTLKKRELYYLTIDSTDLPLNQNHLSELSQLPLFIHAKSKWHNCVVITSTLPTIADSINQFNFIESIELIGEKGANKRDTDKLDYGANEDQIAQMELNLAHNRDYTGKGIDIAVIDGGFSNLNTNPFFDSLYINNQVKSTYNFVKNTPISYNQHAHGALVSSLLSGNIEQSFIGTAPKANYYFLISEDLNQENFIEEFHLIEALEYCDSAGVDVINISLGYNHFDDSRFSHNKNEFTGDSTYLNKACNIGWKKGLFIVSSSGNEGLDSWGVTTTPGNADSVFTVGAVDNSLNFAPFSSKGNPSINSVLKPNVTAIGKQVVLVNQNGTIASSNGTSFSAPQITGFAACLMEAFPNRKNWEIREAIEFSSHQHNQPDSLLGHGLPNFNKAFIYLSNDKFSSNKTNITVYPNPTCGEITITNQIEIKSIKVYDSNGKAVYESINKSEIVNIDFRFLSKGLYLIRVLDENGTSVQKLEIL